MDLLLDLGVNINSVDKDGNTCLHYAVMSKSCKETSCSRSEQGIKEHKRTNA